MQIQIDIYTYTYVPVCESSEQYKSLTLTYRKNSKHTSGTNSGPCMLVSSRVCNLADNLYKCSCLHIFHFKLLFQADQVLLITPIPFCSLCNNVWTVPKKFWTHVPECSTLMKWYNTFLWNIFPRCHMITWEGF